MIGPGTYETSDLAGIGKKTFERKRDSMMPGDKSTQLNDITKSKIAIILSLSVFKTEIDRR